MWLELYVYIYLYMHVCQINVCMYVDKPKQVSMWMQVNDNFSLYIQKMFFIPFSLSDSHAIKIVNPYTSKLTNIYIYI